MAEPRENLRAQYLGRLIGIVECIGRVPDKRVIEELQKAVADYRSVKEVTA